MFWSWGKGVTQTLSNSWLVNGVNGLYIIKKWRNMKYLVIFIFIFFLSCGHECKNFVITKPNLTPAILIGVDGVNPRDSSCLLLKFDLTFVNCKSVFMGGGIEQGLQGINDSVTGIFILDSKQMDITDKIMGPMLTANPLKKQRTALPCNLFSSTRI
jgi:hypothetical protein